MTASHQGSALGQKGYVLVKLIIRLTHPIFHSVMCLHPYGKVHILHTTIQQHSILFDSQVNKAVQKDGYNPY